MTPWQRLTIYCYTLPPPYEATEHLFEELPLSTYPSGTTMEPLAYEMAPGAHLGRAAPWNQALVLFLRVSYLGWRKHAPGCLFVRRVPAGICVRMPPTGARRITSGSGGGGGAERARAGHDTMGLPIGACLLSQGAHRAGYPPPPPLTCYGDDVLAAGGRGGAGSGGRGMIVEALSGLVALFFAQSRHNRRHPRLSPCPAFGTRRSPRR